MNDPDALASFLDKVRARWPEWAVAEVFVPPSQRDAAWAWAALLQELTDAAWGGSDPRPGEAKLAWWQEELAGWAKGAHRHPLGQVLQGLPAAWTTLAEALPALAASRERARDVDEASTTLAPFAAAVVAVESALFAGTTDGDGDGDGARVTASASLLHARLLLPGDEMVPLAVLAAAGESDATAHRRLWAEQLCSHWPRPLAGSRPRRLWAALARSRMNRADPAAPLPGWKTLWTAWRAARD